MAKHYNAVVVDTDADPWTEVWEHHVRSSEAIVMVHSPTSHGAHEARRTLASLDRIDPALAKRCVPMSFGGVPPSSAPGPHEPDAPWTSLPSLKNTSRTTPLLWDGLARGDRCVLTQAAFRIAAVIDQELDR
ncbi:MAG: hypothetical protein Q4G34_01135 [Micrococcus sp.]|nr:hypothetical protein [Micrococcus sp.]